MEETPKKFEDLPKEQQKELKIMSIKFMFRLFFIFINYGGLIILSNVALVILNLMFFNSNVLQIAASVIANVYFLNMMFASSREAADSFHEQTNKILKSK